MSEDEVTGENCTDETKREAYLDCLKLKQAEENAKTKHASANGAYRAALKKWEKTGVNTDAIIYALGVRFDDEEETLIDLREKIKAVELSGHLKNAKDRLLGRLDVIEPTRSEADELDLAHAHDLGNRAGRGGFPKSDNPYQAGSESHVFWVDGWMVGQRSIADEMVPEDDAAGEPVQPPAKPTRGRPKGSGKKAAAEKKAPTSIADRFAPDTAESVAETVRQDVEAGEWNGVDGMPGAPE